MNRSGTARTTMVSLAWVLMALAATVCATPSSAQQPSYDMPRAIDPGARYLFFLHNYYVEKNGPDGDCKYYDILQAFATAGYTVVSEVRSGEIVPCRYSEQVVAQVKQLLAAGVPPGNITVAGHSKGGVIVLCAAAQLADPKINYVVMAGCGIKPMAPAYPDFLQLRGRFLSIYADSDAVAGSCEPALAEMSEGSSSLEIKLKSDAGHALFFKPVPLWLDPVLAWLYQEGS